MMTGRLFKFSLKNGEIPGLLLLLAVLSIKCSKFLTIKLLKLKPWKVPLMLKSFNKPLKIGKNGSFILLTFQSIGSKYSLYGFIFSLFSLLQI